MTTVQSSSNTVTSASTTATRRGGLFGLFHRKKKTKRKSTEKESPGARSVPVSSPRRNNNKNVIKRKDVGGHSPSHSRRFLLDDSNGTVPSTTKVGSSTVKKDDRMTSQSREDKVDAMKKSKAVKQSENAKGGKSLFSRSKRFQKMVDNVFVSIDTDGSGEIDKKELYAGLILIHLRLAAYVGPAACRPATKEYVEEIFDLLDADGSGQLSREEFGTVMAVLLSQITSRIVLYMIFPLVIIPLLARFLMDGISWGLEEWNGRMYGVSIPIPPGIQEVTSAAVEKMHDMVPADLWEKIPMTLISTMLGMLVLPWAIFQLDAFFNKLAANSKKKKKLPAGAEESSGRQAKKTT